MTCLNLHLNTRILISKLEETFDHLKFIVYHKCKNFICYQESIRPRKLEYQKLQKMLKWKNTVKYKPKLSLVF